MEERLAAGRVVLTERHERRLRANEGEREERVEWVDVLRKSFRRSEPTGWQEGAVSRRRYRAQKRTGKEGVELHNFEGLSVVTGFGLSERSPFLLFLLNLLTLGLCSTFFTWHYLSILNLRGRAEEKVKSPTVYLWMLSYLAALAVIVWSGLEYAGVRGGISYLFTSNKPMLCLLYAVFSTIVNRHLLWWVRETLIEEIYAKRAIETRVRPEEFASSYLWLWYVGFPYLQLQINRAIRKGQLRSEARPRKRGVPQESRMTGEDGGDESGEP